MSDNRRYTVLKQYCQDARRILVDARLALEGMSGLDLGRIDQETVLRLFRPVHSLKGVSVMLQEGKPVGEALHALENKMPMLVVGDAIEFKLDQDFRPHAEKALNWITQYLRLLEGKIALWSQLGGDEIQNKGMLLKVSHALSKELLWVPITWLSGTLDPDAPLDPQYQQIGDSLAAQEGLLLELHGQSFILWISQVLAICPKEEAVAKGARTSLTEWLKGLSRRAA